uniref:UBA domain-containing protein n=1 Tax=Helicotheca tamesis TaxID=374047 RepID=A0A7S2HHP3_9STRA|mmetsp:Transcript_18150/g.24972  ORF Transcript_18150/g.24972 Transcript_18150/m.24972 type:complete len:488 (+) Transcript_18150:84-1547(+)
MFKKFTDRVTSAVSNGGAAIFGDEKVRRLESMGFTTEEARQALAATDGDVDRAAELLLVSRNNEERNTEGGGGGNGGTRRRTNPTRADDADEQMRRAMEESLKVEEERQFKAAAQASVSPPPSSAPQGEKKKAPKKKATAANRNNEAMTPAGRAAAERFDSSSQRFGTGATKTKKKATVATGKKSPIRQTNYGGGGGGTGVLNLKSSGLTTHHPNVKVPKKMQDKSKEEQILRCASRLKPHPPAVDTLIRALTAVRDDPSNPKFRRVNKNTAGYQRTLHNKPGAEDMLLAVNFRRVGTDELILDSSAVDPALLYLGISALEGVRESTEYKEAKQLINFEKEIREIQAGSDSSEEEAIKRANFLSKCPTEPADGRGALLQLNLGSEKVSRRFDGDDILADVLHWIGAHGSEIYEKIISREWCLVDLNRYPVAPIDCEKNQKKTLQYIGCWPSGVLGVRPSSEEWKSGANGDKAGSVRGLGAVSASLLH